MSEFYNMSTEKKIILITGSNKGIGFEMAFQLAKSGHEIILTARNADRLNEAVDKLKKEDIKVRGLIMDVSSKTSIKSAVNEFIKLNKTIDVIINNAGIGLNADKSLICEEENVLTDILSVNSLGPLRVIKAFMPFIKKPGRIIMISSGGGSMSDPVGGWWPAYCVSKSFLNAITRHLSYELAPLNISVNAVCPGWVRTDMGGQNATRSVEKGAETPIWLAIEADQNLTGMFFRDKLLISW
jgi:NAD(P)-dependent dehydrogenase (short-subunit alcohol dehydrogenase family)